MKIKSRFKDFYDFPITGYDTDESIVYNRVSKYHDSDPFSNSPDKDLRKYYDHLLRLKRAGVVIMNSKKGDILGIMEFHVIGIYPEITIIPTVSILRDNAPRGYWIGDNPVLGDGELIEVFTEPGIISLEKLEEIAEIYSLELRCVNGSIFDEGNEKGVNFKEKSTRDSKKIEEKDLKVTCPEFFKCLGSPIFYMSNFSRMTEDKGVHSFPGRVDIVTDCNFSELFDINLDLLKSDISIRDRVESFIKLQKYGKRDF